MTTKTEAPHDYCDAATLAVLNRVADKWCVFVVGYLRDSPKRFNEIKRGIQGISQKMLAVTLHGLERDGLVTRTVHATVPPRVEYALSPLGKTLLEPVMVLAAWAHGHRADVEKAQARFDKTSPKALPVK